MDVYYVAQVRINKNDKYIKMYLKFGKKVEKKTSKKGNTLKLIMKKPKPKNITKKDEETVKPVSSVRKVILRTGLSPGDLIMLSAAIRDLKAVPLAR